jgi:hypothetical protein
MNRIAKRRISGNFHWNRSETKYTLKYSNLSVVFNKKLTFSLYFKQMITPLSTFKSKFQKLFDTQDDFYRTFFFEDELEQFKRFC